VGSQTSDWGRGVPPALPLRTAPGLELKTWVLLGTVGLHIACHESLSVYAFYNHELQSTKSQQMSNEQNTRCL